MSQSEEEEFQEGEPFQEGEAFVDPYSQENVGYILFVQQSRIYDALVALLTHFDADKAKDLLEVHARGAIIGPAPNFTGQFITSMMNAEEDESELDENHLN